MFTYFLGYWWFYYSRQLILLNKADDCRYWSTKLFNIFVKHFINFRGNNDVSTISKPVICNFYIFILIESTFYSTIYFRKKGLILFVFLVFSFSLKHFNKFEKMDGSLTRYHINRCSFTEVILQCARPLIETIGGN